MAGERRYIPASEFCASVRDGTHDSPKPVQNGRKLVTSRHLTTGRLDLSDTYRISEEDFEAINKRSKVDRWDVLISMIGTVGEPCLIKEEPDFAIKNIGLFKTKSETDGKWLYYFLRSKEAQQGIREQSRGTTQQYIPLGALRDFPILVADDPEEQKAIAAVLGALDDKIELNRRMNSTLEAMAQALFQSWFVDFDPVRAKLDGRKPVGVDAGTAALFPDSFRDSPLGPIPYGWEVKPLSELTALITKGTTPTQGDRTSAPDVKAPINYIRVNSMDEDGSVLADKVTKIPESVHSGVLKRSILKSNDVLYTIAGTIGRIAIAEHWILPANTNQAVAIIRPESEIPSGFLLLTMRHEVFRKELHNNIVHAVQANLSLGMLSKARAVVPPTTTLLQLFKPIDVLLAQISTNRAQTRTLATLRDTLLPKLLRGELTIGAKE